VNTEQFSKSYANFGLGRSWRQIQHAVKSRQYVESHMQQLFDSMRTPEQRIQQLLGRELKGLRMLEIGPGQGLERARYFGMHNRVTGMDLDMITTRYTPANYLQMARKNGWGRVAKTLGRRVFIGRLNEAAWAKVSEVKQLTDPQILYGNICEQAPPANVFDVAMTWSVFEHLPDPKAALCNLITSLKPGGVFYISLHLYTSHNGHHDIRAFTGDEESLPLWGHLRPSTQHLINPSSFLNKWRLQEWRRLFAEIAPGVTEYLDEYESRERFGPRLVTELRQELGGYTERELFTVNAVYAWKKPW